MRSDNGDFELRFNGLLQVDSLNYTKPMNPVVGGIDIPRMRMYFSGRMTKPFEYQLSFQRSTNSLDVLNAFINVHYDDRLQLKVGRYKAPYTFEWYKLAIWEMPTPDRSPFAPQFWSESPGGRDGLGLSVRRARGVRRGCFRRPSQFLSGHQQRQGRDGAIDYKPFFQSGNPALKNLAIGGSLDKGDENNPLTPAVLHTSTSASSNTMSSTSGDTLISVPFLAFNNNVHERGDRQLFELHASYCYQSLACWESGISATTVSRRVTPRR